MPLNYQDSVLPRGEYSGSLMDSTTRIQPQGGPVTMAQPGTGSSMPQPNQNAFVNANQNARFIRGTSPTHTFWVGPRPPVRPSDPPVVIGPPGSGQGGGLTSDPPVAIGPPGSGQSGTGITSDPPVAIGPPGTGYVSDAPIGPPASGTAPILAGDQTTPYASALMSMIPQTSYQSSPLINEWKRRLLAAQRAPAPEVMPYQPQQPLMELLSALSGRRY